MLPTVRAPGFHPDENGENPQRGPDATQSTVGRENPGQNTGMKLTG
jgi:hypothetical protein